MNTSVSSASRWLTVLAGGIIATLTALWMVRKRQTPQAVAVSQAAAATISTPLPFAVVQTPARSISRWRVRVAWLLGVASCITITVAAVVFQSIPPDAAPTILLVGAVGLLAALFLNPPALGKWTSATQMREPIRWRHAGLGVLCMAVLMWWNLAGIRILSSHLQLLLLVTALGLIAYGFGGTLLPMERWTLRIVGTITLLALLLRVIGLDSAIRFFIDEANFADGVRIALVSNPPLLARFSGITAFPWLYPFMETMATDLFGRNLFGLRIVSAVFGTLTIPAVYVLARALFNKPTALAAALLLATFPPHIHFSRIAINNIADPLFGTLALGWFAWGWRTGRRGYFALAGVAFGLTQYFYDGGRLLYPPLLMSWMIGCVLLLWLRKDDRQGKASGALLMLLVAGIIAAPIYIVSASQAQPFSQRYEQEGAVLGLLSLGDVVQRVWGTFRLYVQNVEGSFFYLGRTPFLLVYTAAPFLIGLVYAAWRALRLDYGGLLLIGWIAVTSAGNALLAQPFVSARYLVVFPALALIASLGLYLALQLLLRRESWARYMLALAVFIIAIGQTVYYFAIHVPVYNDQSRVYQDSQDAAFRSANFPPNTQVHIIADPVEYHSYARAVMWFLRDDVPIDVISPVDFNSDYLERLPRYVDHAFYTLPRDGASQGLIRRYFAVGEAQSSPYTLPPNREFWLLYASRSENP